MRKGFTFCLTRVSRFFARNAKGRQVGGSKVPVSGVSLQLLPPTVAGSLIAGPEVAKGLDRTSIFEVATVMRNS